MTRLNERVGFSGGSVVKNPPAKAVDLSSISGSGKSPGGGNGIPHSSILAWETPWPKDPVQKSSWGRKSQT